MNSNNVSFEARHLIEALRSGVSSRRVGRYFSSARPEIMAKLNGALERTRNTRESGGEVILGKYGEGKTHLLHTFMDIAHQSNMVVSFLSLSKETPLDKLHLIYPKLIAGTFLPGREQPGLTGLFEGMTLGSPITSEMLAYSAKHLRSDKLFFLLRSYLGTEDMDEKYMLLADLEGDFMATPPLKQIYKRIFSEKASFERNFSKTKHTSDYLAFMSRLFLRMGYSGWMILFDEAELIGRLGKKARLNAYANMSLFMALDKDSPLEAVFSLFAMASSYREDVIEGKHERENLAASMLEPAAREYAAKALERIASAPQLNPLTKEEIGEITCRIQRLHAKAYGWTPPEDAARLPDERGYLLRTRIRGIVERLDQLYQYGSAGDLSVSDLADVSFDEEPPSLDALVE